MSVVRLTRFKLKLIYKDSAYPLKTDPGFIELAKPDEQYTFDFGKTYQGAWIFREFRSGNDLTSTERVYVRTRQTWVLDDFARRMETLGITGYSGFTPTIGTRKQECHYLLSQEFDGKGVQVEHRKYCDNWITDAAKGLSPSSGICRDKAQAVRFIDSYKGDRNVKELVNRKHIEVALGMVNSVSTPGKKISREQFKEEVLMHQSLMAAEAARTTYKGEWGTW
tara:strand:+ start:496 stop:1164 length:669 start_codon:yes stop_codon:yes gene_type:complete